MAYGRPLQSDSLEWPHTEARSLGGPPYLPEPIRAPKAHRAALRLLAEISEPEFEQVLSILQGSSASTLDRGDLANKLQDALAKRAGAQQLVDAVTGAQVLLENRSLSPEVTAERVAAHPDLGLSDEEQTVLARRFSACLAVQELAALSRAIVLYTESSDKRFCTARSFSELVPVFATDESLELSATFVKHTLRIEFHTQNTNVTERILLTLDDRNIQELQGVLARALDKSTALRRSVTDGGGRLVELEIEH